MLRWYEGRSPAESVFLSEVGKCDKKVREETTSPVRLPVDIVQTPRLEGLNIITTSTDMCKGDNLLS